jgi:hypothetical protein
LQVAHTEKREFAVLPHRPDAIVGVLSQTALSEPAGGGVPGAPQGTDRLRAAEV